MPRRKKEAPEAASEADLMERLRLSEEANARLLGEKEVSEARIASLESAQKQGAFFGSTAQEFPTGNKVRMRVFDHYKVVGHKEESGDEIRKPVFKTEEVETFYYKIDMAPCGDACLKINGMEYHHGQVYELDIHTLRTVKDIVARTWTHDKSIHPGDENFYRKDASWQSRNSRAINRGVL